jgi:drug/metabolite transporter (DMT)-like permease
MSNTDAAAGAPRRLGGDSMARAVLFMCLSVGMFSVLNATVKLLGQRYPLPEVFWMRYAGHTAFCLIAFLPRRGLALFSTRHPCLHAARTVLLFACSALMFLGLQLLPLPTATAITFVSPILVTALSVPLLGEHVGRRRWTAVAVGFLGALVIIRPSPDLIQWGAVLVLLDALFYALYQIISRKVGSLDPAEVSITLVGVGGLLLATPLLPLADIVLPSSPRDIVLFLTIGFWGLLGHYCVIRALQWGSASLVAPLGYGELIGSAILGWVLFAEFPDAWSWLGAAMIVGSGLYIVRREQKLRRAR